MRRRAHQSGRRWLAVWTWLAMGVFYLQLPLVKGQAPRVSTDWPLETVELDDGRVLRGLIDEEDASSIEFIELRRPAGRSMSLIVRRTPRAGIAAIERLGNEERELLRRRIREYRNRARIEAMRAETIDLRARSIGGFTWWIYEADERFILRTTLEEPIARRVAVRLEQIFSAYRQVLSPQHRTGPRPVTIVVHGTRDEYASELAKQNLDFRNPAYYEPKTNRVVAGCSLNEALAESRRVEESHARVREQLARWDAEFETRLSQQIQELARQGAPAGERNQLAAALRRKWTQQAKEKQKEILNAERQNRELLDIEIQQLVRMLYHESSHAYLANTLFDTTRYEPPIWLNEGLAQVFESARIEADVMRIDAPDARRLAQLQEDLRRGDRLSLEALVTATPEAFIGAHGMEGAAVNRNYLYAWGVVYYLIFESPDILDARMEDYVLRSPATDSAVHRFERFVGRDLVACERDWINAMLAMKSHSDE